MLLEFSEKNEILDSDKVKIIIACLAPICFLSVGGFIFQLLTFLDFSSFLVPFIGTSVINFYFFRQFFRQDSTMIATNWVSKKEFLIYLLLLLIASLLYNLGSQSIGGWDAWAMWNLHAKFLSDAEHWKNMFHPSMFWNSPDYPLLLPSINAWLHQLFPNPYAVFYFSSFIWYATTISVVFFLFRPHFIISYLVVLSLILNKHFMMSSVYQGADAAMAMFILIVVTLSLRPFNKYTMLLCAFALGCIFNLKNEGLAFFVASVVIFIQPIIKHLKFFLTGLSLPSLCYVLFKLNFAPAGYMSQNTQISKFANFADWQRYVPVFQHALATLSTNMPLVLLYLPLCGYILFQRRINKSGILIGWMIIIYHGIYIFYDFISMEWQLQTSFQRMIVHLFPSILVLTSLAILTKAVHKKSHNYLVIFLTIFIVYSLAMTLK